MQADHPRATLCISTRCATAECGEPEHVLFYREQPAWDTHHSCSQLEEGDASRAGWEAA